MDSHISKKGYQGFGSFHSENVELMISIPDNEYIPPALPVSIDIPSPLEFGLKIKEQFCIDPTWTFINHGAFGGALKFAVNGSHQLTLYAESQPVRYIDRELFPLMVYSIRSLAKFLKVSSNQIVLVPNVTYALNTIIRTNSFIERDSVVFVLDIGYGSVKKMVLEACATTNATIHVCSIKFPLKSSQDFIDQVSHSFPSNVSLAVFDHITSNTGMVLPIKELVQIAKSRGAKVLIDGAHGLQSQDLSNISSLGCDFYVSNCHKWLSNPKGVAFMYAAKEHTSIIKPAVISHGFNEGFTSNFVWDGTRDYSNMVLLPLTLKWWEQVDHERARSYCRKLLQSAVDLLSSRWGTTTHVPMEFYSHMACVQVPHSSIPPGSYHVNDDGSIEYKCNSTHSKMIQDALHYHFKIECPIKTLEKKSYVRISAMVYNVIGDYETLSDAVSNLRWSSEVEFLPPTSAGSR
jgi:isopenicillin-N epimerase